ncbi:ComEA family DNA-binding protein [Ferviditalea candida]|uniref:Helix-hairpin-helix domain-containing protein n=1 Tax=Ferviditalea candida TaxID=3108399 RepID=A0ABU5ZDZ4_9BACL|nr:helix-hairpin-helix domain-containing protein [Paenibacillaceae bacterium T2]
MFLNGERSIRTKLLLFILLMVVAAVAVVYSVRERANVDGQWMAVNDDMNRLLQESAKPISGDDQANVSGQRAKGGHPSGSADISAKAQTKRPETEANQAETQTNGPAEAKRTEAQGNQAETQGNRAPLQPPGEQLININLASLQELDLLPGIGPSKAKAIVDYRSANGEFRSIDEIMKVKGIGPQIFGKLKSRITVGNQPDQVAVSRPKNSRE